MTIDDGGSDGGGEEVCTSNYLLTQGDSSSLKRKPFFGNGIKAPLRKNLIYLDSGTND